MIRLKIDLLKLTNAKPFTAKDGTAFIAVPIEVNNVFVSQKGAHYLDLTLMENRDGRDQYDQDGFCSVDLGKERRLAGEKGPILGNWKNLDGATSQGRNPMGGVDRTANEARSPAQAHANQADDDSDEEIPF